jgi:hypothetical protein
MVRARPLKATTLSCIPPRSSWRLPEELRTKPWKICRLHSFHRPQAVYMSKAATRLRRCFGLPCTDPFHHNSTEAKCVGTWIRPSDHVDTRSHTSRLYTQCKQRCPAVSSSWSHKMHTGSHDWFLNVSWSAVNIRLYTNSQLKNLCFPSALALQMAFELKLQKDPWNYIL